MFYRLIMAFDLLVQAIEQLYRAFEIDHPLEGDQSVFNQSVTDDMYFAHIRACFGAHSVELKSIDGTPPPKKSKDRYFASWSSDALEAIIQFTSTATSQEMQLFLYH